MDNPPTDKYASNTDSLVSQLTKVYFELDEGMQISHVSSTLLHHIPTLAGQSLNEAFDIIRPSGVTEFQEFQQKIGAMVLLVSKVHNFAIRGQFSTTEELCGRLVFVGAPWLSWLAKNAPSDKIRIQDFTATDVQLDQLIFVATEQRNVQDLQNLADELKVARDKAEKINEERSQFFALMSHEMRTPLNGVASALELISDQELSGESLEMLRIARRSAANLKRVIDQVLNFSKLKAGGFVNEPNTFDLSRTLSAVTDLYTPLLQQQKNTLKVVGDKLDCLLIADEAKLRQVLINLVGNAVKHTHHGDIVVSSELNRELGQLKVCVTDTGSGIPTELQARLFDPYWTFDSTRGTTSGTGLGLYVCKQFMSIMGGALSFKSVAEQGTRFTLKFPVKIETDLSVLDAPPAEQARFSGHVLIVEDNKVNQYLAKSMLERRGLTVDIAENGAEAISCVDDARYDLVFMDISMPVMDGEAATQVLRQRFNKVELPIVAMTAHAADEDHKRFLGLGMNSVMSKPIDTTLLDTTLTKWCKSTQLREQELDDMSIPESQSEELIIAELAEKLRAELGDDMFREIAQMFQGEVAQKLPEIMASYNENDLDSLAKKAHSIRSSAATLGLMPLSRRLKHIELVAKGVESGDISELTESFPDLLERSLNQLARYCDSLS